MKNERFELRWWACLSLLLLAWVFYACSGVIQWGDNGAFLIRASLGQYFSPELLAMSHPLYTTVSSLAHKVGGFYGVAHLNALLLVLAAGELYLLARQLGGTRSAAWLAVAAGVTVHSVLWVATKVEVYLLHLVLVLGCLAVFQQKDGWCSGIRRWVLLGLLTGMGIATHQLTFIVLTPMVAVLLIQEIRGFHWYVLGVVLGLFSCLPGLIGDLNAGKSLLEIVRAFLTNGSSHGGTGWESELFSLRGVSQHPRQVVLVLLSIVGLGLPGTLIKPAAGARTLIWACAWFNLLFAASYDVFDRYTFFLPGGVLFALLGALWLSERAWPAVWRWVVGVALVLGPIAVTHGPVLLIETPLLKHTALHASIVAQGGGLLAPLLKDDSAEEFVRAYEKVVPPGSIVFADWPSHQALANAQRMGIFVGRDLARCEAFPTLASSLKQDAYVAQDCLGIDAKLREPAVMGWHIRRAAVRP